MTRFLLMLLVGLTPPANAKFKFNLGIDLSPEYDGSYASDLDPYAPRGLKASYLSSVVVQVFNEQESAGHGSGNYFKLNKHRFILTAAHVVDDSDEIYILEKGMVITKATVVYSNTDTDIALLIPEKRLRYTKPIPFRRDINNQLGEKTYHCGHPTGQGWHISEGLLTGNRNDILMINTFAWPGSSGSVVFDEGGRVIGIVSAVMIDGPFGMPSMVEHIVLSSNIKMLSPEKLRALLENEK